MKKSHPERDFNLIYHINLHYKDLQQELSTLNSLDDFSCSNFERKATLFDFFQIGELLNHLSDEFCNIFGSKEIYSVVSIRNIIVHGYGSVEDRLVYNSLKNELPSFIKRINNLAESRYGIMTNALIGKMVKVLYDENGLPYTDRLTSLYGGFQKLIIKDNAEIIEGKTITIINIRKIGKETYLIGK